MARAAQSSGGGTKAIPTSVPDPIRQATNVLAIVDVVGALSAGTVAQSLFLFDNNHRSGSTGHGSDSLSSAARVGDVVVWTTISLECEAFARLQQVEIDSAYAGFVELGAGAFSETPEVYWFARILKPLPAEGVPYRLSYRLGSAREAYRTPVDSRLVPPPGTPVAPPPPLPGPTDAPPLSPVQEDVT